MQGQQAETEAARGAENEAATPEDKDADMNGEEGVSGCHAKREGGDETTEEAVANRAGQEGRAVGLRMMAYSAVLTSTPEPDDPLKKRKRQRRLVQQGTCEDEAGEGKPLMSLHKRCKNLEAENEELRKRVEELERNRPSRAFEQILELSQGLLRQLTTCQTNEQRTQQALMSLCQSLVTTQPPKDASNEHEFGQEGCGGEPSLEDRQREDDRGGGGAGGSEGDRECATLPFPQTKGNGEAGRGGEGDHSQEGRSQLQQRGKASSVPAPNARGGGRKSKRARGVAKNSKTASKVSLAERTLQNKRSGKEYEEEEEEEEEEEKAEELWVECENCKKWRKVPPGVLIDSEKSFFCKMLPAVTCDTAEEDWDEEETEWVEDKHMRDTGDSGRNNGNGGCGVGQGGRRGPVGNTGRGFACRTPPPTAPPGPVGNTGRGFACRSGGNHHGNGSPKVRGANEERPDANNYKPLIKQNGGNWSDPDDDQPILISQRPGRDLTNANRGVGRGAEGDHSKGGFGLPQRETDSSVSALAPSPTGGEGGGKQTERNGDKQLHFLNRPGGDSTKEPSYESSSDEDLPLACRKTPYDRKALLTRIHKGLEIARGKLASTATSVPEVLLDLRPLFAGFTVHGTLFWRQRGELYVLGCIESSTETTYICKYADGSSEELGINPVLALVMKSVEVDTKYLKKSSPDTFFIADDVDRDLLEAECVAALNMPLANKNGGEGGQKAEVVRQHKISFDHSVAKYEKLLPIPPEFICPLSLSLLKSPAKTCSSGGSCESVHLHRFLIRREINPHTGEQLQDTNVIPNGALTSRIDAWVKENAYEQLFSRSCHGGGLGGTPVAKEVARIPQNHKGDQTHKHPGLQAPDQQTLELLVGQYFWSPHHRQPTVLILGHVKRVTSWTATDGISRVMATCTMVDGGINSMPWRDCVALVLQSLQYHRDTDIQQLTFIRDTCEFRLWNRLQIPANQVGARGPGEGSEADAQGRQEGKTAPPPTSSPRPSSLTRPPSPPVPGFDKSYKCPLKTLRMDQSRGEANVCMYANLTVTAADIRTLTPGKYLNDTMMDVGAQMIVNHLSPTKRKQIHVFGSMFWKKIVPDQATCETPEARILCASRWIKDITDFFTKKFVFVPICVKYHWRLAIICNPRLGSVTKGLYLDSLGSDDPGLDVLWDFLKFVWRQQQHELPENLQLSSFHHVTVPQQRDSHSCGLFVLEYLRRFVSDLVPEKEEQSESQEDATNELNSWLTSMGTGQWFGLKEPECLRAQIAEFVVSTASPLHSNPANSLVVSATSHSSPATSTQRLQPRETVTSDSDSDLWWESISSEGLDEAEQQALQNRDRADQ
jgi:hypothetical protein